MDLGAGVSIDIGTSQGFSQIGETVQNRTVGGRNIAVKGVVYSDIQNRKRAIRNTFAPFSYGRLVFENQYYIRVCVNLPSFFTDEKDGAVFTQTRI